MERLDLYQRAHPWLGFPLAVLYKVFDDRGIYLAALVTYYSFVALFPLLLLFVSVAGFFLHGNVALQRDVINSAVGSLPGIGQQLRQNITGFKGSGAGVAVGVIGTLYGALGATQAAQMAFNTMYAVPRNEQPNPLRSRLRSLGLVALLGSLIVVSSGVNILISTGNGLSAQLDDGLIVLGYAVGLVLSTALFTVAYQLLTAVELHWRDVVLGGVISGAAWELLQIFGSRYVVHEVGHGSSLYGVFGVVLAVLAYIFLAGMVLMVSAEINVVASGHLWPRSLFSPFTDDMEPTPADLESFRRYARAQRFKGWEVIDVDFRPPGLSSPSDPDRPAGPG